MGVDDRLGGGDAAVDRQVSLALAGEAWVCLESLVIDLAAQDILRVELPVLELTGIARGDVNAIPFSGTDITPSDVCQPPLEHHLAHVGDQFGKFAHRLTCLGWILPNYNRRLSGCPLTKTSGERRLGHKPLP